MLNNLHQSSDLSKQDVQNKNRMHKLRNLKKRIEGLLYIKHSEKDQHSNNGRNHDGKNKNSNAKSKDKNDKHSQSLPTVKSLILSRPQILDLSQGKVKKASSRKAQSERDHSYDLIFETLSQEQIDQIRCFEHYFFSREKDRLAFKHYVKVKGMDREPQFRIPNKMPKFDPEPQEVLALWIKVKKDTQEEAVANPQNCFLTYEKPITKSSAQLHKQKREQYLERREHFHGCFQFHRSQIMEHCLKERKMLRMNYFQKQANADWNRKEDEVFMSKLRSDSRQRFESRAKKAKQIKIASEDIGQIVDLSEKLRSLCLKQKVAKGTAR